MNRLLLTLTLGIASCGIGWGQESGELPTKPTRQFKISEKSFKDRDLKPGTVVVMTTDHHVCRNEGGTWDFDRNLCTIEKPELVDVKSLKSANSCEKIKAAIASAPKLKHRAPIIDATKIPDAFNCPLSVFAVDNLDLMLKMSDGSEVFIFKLKPQTGDHQ